ncbi:MAG: HEPN domain-containing protein [Planctomycetes bacterium]|nr:HEPN domain-containing protein [Planctomycetota bacterium]
MPDPNEVLDVVREWIEKAESDVTIASRVLKMRDKSLADNVGFHIQQCLEKYIKALLIYCNIDFPRTHNIVRLAELLPKGIDLEMSISEQEKISEYAVETRYPGDRESVTIKEVREAMSLVKKARSQIRKLLPKSVKTKRKTDK